MQAVQRRRFLATLATGAIGCRRPRQNHRGAPPQLAADARTFVALINALSERGTSEILDNYLSNEASYLDVADVLGGVVPSHAYLGVGPEQNFSYIALTRPSIAFIVDYRRDNLLLHLVYKALFARARSRAEFLALMLGRTLERVVDVGAEVPELLSAIDGAAMRREPFDLRADLAPYSALLSKRDGMQIEVTQRVWFDRQLDRTPDLAPRAPTLRTLLSARAPSGRFASFLADETRFRSLRALHGAHRIVPVVGDLSGSHTFTTIAALLRAQSMAVGSIYVSNVELAAADARRWRAHLATLPRDRGAVLIRSEVRDDRSRTFAEPVGSL